MVKVVFLDDSGAPGGGQLALKRYLASASPHERTLISLSDGELWHSGLQTDVGYYPLTDGRGAFRVLATAPKLHRLLKELRPDAIVINSLRALQVLSFTPRARNLRCVFYLREAIDPDRLGKIKYLFTSAVSLRRIDSVWANSQWMMDAFAERHTRVANIRLVHTASGVSGEQQVTQPPCSDGPAKLSVGFVGRLHPSKGIHTILDAVARVEAELGAVVPIVLVGGTELGSTSYKEFLLQMIEDLRLQVRFTGHLEDPWKALYATEIFVTASDPPEPFGQVIVQALAQGKVVIAPDTGGGPEILGANQWGELYSSGDVADLAAAIMRLWGSPDRRAQLKRLALARATVFSDEASSAETDDALSALASA